MSSRVEQAIVTRWDAKNGNTTFTGGLHFAERAQGDSDSPRFPYVVMDLISSVPSGFNSLSVIRVYRFQFTIYIKEDNSTDPRIAIGAKMDSLHGFFDFAPLSIATAFGQIIECRPDAESDVVKEDDDIWSQSLDYMIRRAKPMTYSPA